MSWKSLVCAGLFCALVTPAFAVPTADAVLNGSPGNPVLNGSGNFEWNVRVTPDGVGAIDTEIAVTATQGGLLGITNANSGLWDHNVPANKPNISPDFDFWTEFTSFGIASSGNNGMIGLGSGPQVSGTPVGLAVVETDDPYYVNAGDYRLTTTIKLYGGYAGDTAGRLAQSSGNNDNVTGTYSFSVIPGDATLNGSVDIGDYNAWFTSTGINWDDADFNDNDSVDIGDYNIWFGSGGVTLPPLGAGAGSGSAAVPEPSSLVLAAVMGLALAGFRRMQGA